MQNSIGSVFADLIAQLIAALFGILTPPLQFELPETTPVPAGTAACNAGAFGLSANKASLDIVCLGAAGVVSVVASDGSGEVRQTSTTLYFEYWEETPAASDVNGDGLLDLVALAGLPERECEIVALLGDGRGGFGETIRQQVESPLSDPVWRCLGLAAGDFDEDGALDFVVPYIHGEADTQLGSNIYRTREDGGFELSGRIDDILPSHDPTMPSSSRPMERNSTEPLVFDANADGHADLAFIADGGWIGHPELTNSLHVYLGDGTGQFRTGSVATLSGQSVTYVLDSADYDDDGNADLAFSVKGDAWAYNVLRAPQVMFGSGDGSFSEPLVLGATASSGDLYSTDFDADGRVDLIASSFAGSLYLYASTGDRNFGTPIGFAIGRQPQWISSVTSADGSRTLLAATEHGIDSLPLPLNVDAPGAPRVSSFATQVDTAWQDDSIVLADVDRDGDSDLVSFGRDGVFLYSNEHTGAFSATQLLPPSSTALLALAAADLNEDGLTDIVTFGADGAARSLALHAQRDDGSWGPAVPLVQRETSTYYASHLVVADMNADGRLDLVTWGEDYGPPTQVDIDVQSEPGVFTRHLEWTVEGRVHSVQDVDADGRFDLVVSLGSLIGVSRGDGEGGFALDEFVDATVREAEHVVVADMNQDGQLDFVTSKAVHLARSNGDFDSLPFPSAFAQATLLDVADLNSDGFPDVVLDEYEVYVYSGRGDGSLGEPQRVFSTNIAPQVLIADFSGDDLPDLLIANPLIDYLSANYLELAVVTNVSREARGP